MTNHISATSAIIATAAAQAEDYGTSRGWDGGWLWLAIIALVLVGGFFYMRSRSRRGPLP